MSETDRFPHITSGKLIVDKVWCEREAAFDWKIGNFSSLPNGTDDPCYSPDFRFCGRTWHLVLFPAGETTFKSKGYVGLYLCSRGRGAPLEVRFSSGILTAKGESKIEVTGTANFGEACKRFCVSRKMIARWELFERAAEMLPLDLLTVRVTLKDELPTEDTERDLQEIGKMWQCDVVLRVRDVEFKAHKAILVARTPALGAMFRHDTPEKASEEAAIDDCEPAVFEQFLHYIYKGALRQLTAENACALYILADRYLVSEVKELCLRCMRETLCVDTFCNTVSLSLMHGEDELLETAVDFFARNMLCVVETVQWQMFLREHSAWVYKILIHVLNIQARYEERRFGRHKGRR